MDQRTAIERLGISRKTFIKYRKELGIFKETRKNITEGQLLRIEELKNRKGGLTPKAKIELMERAEAQETPDILEIEPKDGPKVRKLKEQYNRYSRFLDMLGEEILDVAIEKRKLPPKDVTSLIERYQTLLIKVSKELRHVESAGTDLGELINEKLKEYS